MGIDVRVPALSLPKIRRADLDVALSVTLTGALKAINAIVAPAGKIIRFADADNTELLPLSDAIAPLLGSATVADFVAALGTIPASQLPAIAITDTFVVSSEAEMTALVAERGDIAVRTDLNKSFALAGDDPTDISEWKEMLTPTDAVLSVAGLTGAIDAAALKTALAITMSSITDASPNGRSLVTAADYAAMKTMLAITAANITDATANGRSLITAANYAAMKTLLGIATADITDVSANGQTLLTAANYAAMRALLADGGTVTANSPLFSLIQTWNAGAVNFDAFLLNVTNVSSGINSTVLNLQVGGSPVARVFANGNLNVAGGATISGAGDLSFSTRSKISAPADGNILLRNNAGTGFTSLQLGGPTSSFPALKRSGAKLQARLADDSGYAEFERAGTATNDDAPAGVVGEYKKQAVLAVSAIALSNGNAANIASISLEAGDWEVWGQAAFDTGSTTDFTALRAGVSRTSAILPNTGDDTQGRATIIRSAGVIGINVDPVIAIPRCRMSLNATTTVYLVEQCDFTAGTVDGYGYIAARRVR